ncbi:hypothetical protein COCOBI_12-4320 [Coccomyxa sp. Obi]|nr:hypothetical protein COCOBI_12-4320 [Coccomyxa sp. Obi]
MKCLRGSGVAEACSNVPVADQATGLGGDYNDKNENSDEDEEEEEEEEDDESDTISSLQAQTSLAFSFLLPEMPPRRCRSKAPAKVELPEPLWAQIASHLSIKDGAKVSGTCKTTFRLQPRTIDIPLTTPLAGVIWASKRLRSVEVLRLRANGALGLAGTGVQDSNSLMSLKQLEIGAPSAADTTTAFMMWFAWDEEEDEDVDEQVDGE